MDLEFERDSGLLLAKLGGRLDGSNSREFEAALSSEISPGDSSVVLDMGELNYISSAGLRAILLIAKSVKAKNGKLALCSLSGQIEEIFTISGFDKVIPIHSDRQAASAAVSS